MEKLNKENIQEGELTFLELVSQLPAINMEKLKEMLRLRDRVDRNRRPPVLAVELLHLAARPTDLDLRDPLRRSKPEVKTIRRGAGIAVAAVDLAHPGPGRGGNERPGTDRVAVRPAADELQLDPAPGVLGGAVEKERDAHFGQRREYAASGQSLQREARWRGREINRWRQFGDEGRQGHGLRHRGWQGARHRHQGRSFGRGSKFRCCACCRQGFDAVDWRTCACQGRQGVG